MLFRRLLSKSLFVSINDRCHIIQDRSRHIIAHFIVIVTLLVCAQVSHCLLVLMVLANNPNLFRVASHTIIYSSAVAVDYQLTDSHSALNANDLNPIAIINYDSVVWFAGRLLFS